MTAECHVATLTCLLGGDAAVKGASHGSESVPEHLGNEYARSTEEKAQLKLAVRNPVLHGWGRTGLLKFLR